MVRAEHDGGRGKLTIDDCGFLIADVKWDNRHPDTSKITNPQSAIFNPENHPARARRRSGGTGVDG
jgi:hypothetical protein